MSSQFVDLFTSTRINQKYFEQMREIETGKSFEFALLRPEMFHLKALPKSAQKLLRKSDVFK